MQTSDLDAFKEIVNKRCGLNFQDLAEGSLVAALTKRMTATDCETAADYFTRILGDGIEFQELVELLTVNETYFFREPSQLNLLVDSLVPRLLIDRAHDRPIRILSAGCSSGEEPYSIAIALKEKFGESAGRLTTIIAVDIDQQALTKARRAEYGAFSFRALPAEIRDRHFTRMEPHRYRLDDGVRSLVEFHQLNLLSSDYSAIMRDFDIVFFRNVSIYFDAATRKAILSNLRAVMNKTAVLILGTSETLANDLGIFHLVEEDGGFYFTRTASAATSKIATTPRRAAPRPKATTPRPQPVEIRTPPPPSPSPTIDWRRSLETIRILLREKDYALALQAVHALEDGAADDIRCRLLESHVRLQMHQFAEATAIAAQALRRDPWSIEAHMLTGLAAKWLDDKQTAIQSLRTVIYSKPDCWPAHYYLGTLLQDIDVANAHRAYTVALRQITAHPDPDGGLWLPLDLPVADIRFLCERHGDSLGISGQEQSSRGSRR